MCGIAGFTIAPGVGLERTALARLLLAGIAERGTDATGYGYHRPDGTVEVHKESLRLREFVEQVDVPEGAGEAIFHVRGYTKGVPSVNDNNHPGALRARRRRAQRPSRQRRRALPAPPRAALDAAHHRRLRGDRDARRPQRRHRRGARRGARQRRRRRALGRRAGAPDARAPRLAPALPRPRRRLRPVRVDGRAARARRARHGPRACASRRSPRAARSSCARATSSRAAASTSTAATSASRSSRIRRWPRSPRCCASRSPRSSAATALYQPVPGSTPEPGVLNAARSGATPFMPVHLACAPVSASSWKPWQLSMRCQAV